MSKFRVTKILEFCYGHRLLHYAGKCKHLHGHQAKVEIDLESEPLDRRGMVYDFIEIKEKLKPWIDTVLDHKTILNEADPLVPLLREMKEPIFLLPENPTAENLAKLIFRKSEEVGLPVVAVRLWESADAFATFRK